MVNEIEVGDLVVQRRGDFIKGMFSRYKTIGLVLSVQYGRSEMPKNEPDQIYEYALVFWSSGHKVTIKTSLLEKIS